MMMADYPSEHTVVLNSVMTNDDTWPTVIRGQYGTMNFDSDLKIKEQAVWSEEFRKANPQAAPAANDPGEEVLKPGQAMVTLDAEARRDHMGNFLDAVRNGDRLACDVDLGCSVMVAIKMGVEAYRQNCVMNWNPETQEMYRS